MPSLRLVFAGTPATALPSLRALLASPHEVLGVVTRPDARTGRGRRVEPSPVRALAVEHGIPTLTPQRTDDPEFLTALQELAPDLCPVVAYGGMLRPATLELPRLGWINLHFSLLPAWRGAAPVQAAVWHGDALTGATVFHITAGLDEGPILGTLTEPIKPTDTTGELLERLAAAGAELLVSCVDAIAAGRAAAVAQPSDGVSVAPKLTVADAQVDWRLPAFAIDRRIRACTPSPGAWTTFRGERLKLHPVSEATSEAAPLAPGALTVADDAVLVGTATHPVALGLVQPAGKKPMPAAAWARGARLVPDERLGDNDGR